MEEIRNRVWETDESELNELIDAGYEVIYFDVSLSVIYKELTNCFTNDEQIEQHFGYYGLNELLQVDGMYYWIMQV